MVSKRINRGNQPEGIVGYRFHPTDGELVGYYLERKNGGREFSVDDAINEVKICDHDPWELPAKANIKSKGDSTCYFFSKPDLKFPKSQRSRSRDLKPITKRATKSGCWKPTGVDRIIRKDGKKIGIKKTLVFHGRKQHKGQKSNWVMHEYHSDSVSPNAIPYVLCKVKFKEGNNESVISPSWEVGQTSYSPVSSSQTPAQHANYETHQPAAEQSTIDLEKVDFQKESWSDLAKMFGVADNHILTENKDEDLVTMMKKFAEEVELPPAVKIQEGYCDQISVSYYESRYDYSPCKSIAGEYFDSSDSESESEITHHKGFEEMASPVESVGSSEGSNKILVSSLDIDENKEALSEDSAVITGQISGDLETIASQNKGKEAGEAIAVCQTDWINLNAGTLRLIHVMIVLVSAVLLLISWKFPFAC